MNVPPLIRTALRAATSASAARVVQSLELTRRLAKASKKARKFVVYSEQLGKTVYVGARLELFPMTFDIKEARMFLEGFDEPRAKVAYWNIAIPAIDWMVKHL